MEITNRIYVIDYKIANHSSYMISYSLDEAISCGMQQFTDEFYELYDRRPCDNNEFDKFVNDYYPEPYFTINVISGNRLRFKTSKELIEYFMNNIKNINNENLYDFLLSFIECDILFYDYKGNFVNSDKSSQCPSEEYVWDPHIEFTEESCKEGKFRFSYDDIGIDTLYHAKWIKEK